MPADFDEPVFDEAFVRGAAFTEPSARERSRRPSRRALRAERRRSRAARPPRGRRFRDPSRRMAVLQVLAAILVLLAISIALWWWNKPSAELDTPVRNAPGVPTEPVVSPSAPAPEPAVPQV